MKLFIALLSICIIPLANGATAQPASLAPQDKIILDEADSDILIKKFDQARGTYIGTYHTGKDSSKLSILYHINPAVSFSNFTDVSTINTFEFDYTVRRPSYWINFLFAHTSANIEKLSSTLATALPNSSDTINSFGLGLYQRFHLFDNFFQMGNLYESVEANMTYNIITNSVIAEQFSGLGLKSDFGIFYRISSKIHYGVKLSYNLVSAENSDQLAHTISWFSLGFDISLYL